MLWKTQSDSLPYEISITMVKCGGPTVWFGQAGAQVALKGVTISGKHFYYVISCLPQDITDASAASTYDGL